VSPLTQGLRYAQPVIIMWLRFIFSAAVAALDKITKQH